MSQYRIKTVSKITNIPIDTIRNWEKRYSFLKPSVGQNGEKIYSDDDIYLLRKITNLLKTGGRISEIASQILDGSNFDTTDLEDSKISNEVMLMIEDYYQYLQLSDLDKIDQIESLIEITVVFKNRIDFIYYPLLERIRQDSARGLMSVAQEYFVTGHILNKLKGFLSSSVFKNTTYDICPIICATPANAIYEGGMLTLACSLKLKGHNIYYLGANLPVTELFNFSLKIQPAVIAISINDPADLDAIIKTFQNAKAPVCVGGLGVRLADRIETQIQNIHLIPNTGAIAVEKLESVCLEYLQDFKRKT